MITKVVHFSLCVSVLAKRKKQTTWELQNRINPEKKKKTELASICKLGNGIVELILHVSNQILFDLLVSELIAYSVCAVQNLDDLFRAKQGHNVS